MSNMIGHIINDRYELQSLLGDGGMGTVYRAQDRNLNRQVAIKLMHPHYARRQEFRNRLIQEARVAAKLDHPSIVRIFDFGDSPEGLFITMEYVDGGSLRAHLRRLQQEGKFLPLAQSLQIGIHMAAALDYAHRRDIVHRDVKPGNIILKRLACSDEPSEQPFRAILTDFGLVKLTEGSNMTESGMTLGTPTYMSPEQCQGNPVDRRSDLYSLGVVLYELFTNRLPFAFQSLSDAIAVHQRGTMPQLAREVRPDLPQIIDVILLKLLAKNANERYPTGGDLVKALRSALLSLEGAPTQVMSQESDILANVTEAPEGFFLVINTPGHPASHVPLTQATVTLGRNADNDIVLPAEGVSRHHARVQATSLGWEVLDLGGINGTFVNDHRLRANDHTPMTPGERLRIGPYELVLQGPQVTPYESDLVATMAGGKSAVSLGHTAPATEIGVPEKPPLEMFLAQNSFTVEPGRRCSINVEIVNHTMQDDRVTVRVQGIPDSWVIVPNEYISVPAGETIQVAIAVNPRRTARTPSGRQKMYIQLRSQQFRELNVGKSVTLQVAGFVAFEASLSNTQVRLPEHVSVTIQNIGNTRADFSVMVDDPHKALKVQGQRGRISIENGRARTVELKLAARQRVWRGSSDMYPFSVVVSAANGRQVTLDGEAKTGMAIPPALLYVLLFVVVFCITVALAVAIFGRDNIFGGGGMPFNTSTSAPIQETQTVIAHTPTLDVTAVTLTPAPGQDTDGDGLSDEQEQHIGTDPSKPDTDLDLLLDGEEVLSYGTNPLDRDTDKDALVDGDEIRTWGTNPVQWDTSGDGISDGQAVANGWDPLLRQTATPTISPVPSATATPGVSPTATHTPPAVTASLTPTLEPSWTFTPSATPTASGTPTFTPTPSETPVSPTPTMTNTPVDTSTPTNTPMPNPEVACQETPPTIDGVFDITEWPASPQIQFSPEGNPSALVQGYLVRQGDNLYSAWLLNDVTDNPSDSLRLYFDTISNRGDPDTADRFFQVVRDETVTVQAGIGNNADGLNWNPGYTSSNWTAVIGEPGTNQWVVEMNIDVGLEMPSLSNPYGMMVQALSGELAIWPPDGDSVAADTWQGVDWPACP
ncbi:MAG: hypothetical protein CSA11_00615 [Chloroflexi bacterium]|nr:MAG: hypothetical protein CSA11_00615 [Chloroflexota bacterium]